MRPRGRTKPSFPQTVSTVQPQAISQSSAAALSPLPVQSASASAEDINNVTQDAYAERRASGQSASTSGADQEMPSILRQARGRANRRNGSNAPFASLSLHHGQSQTSSNAQHAYTSHQTPPCASLTNTASVLLQQPSALTFHHPVSLQDTQQEQSTLATAQDYVQFEAGDATFVSTSNDAAPSAPPGPVVEVAASSIAQYNADDVSTTANPAHKGRGSKALHKTRRHAPSAFPQLSHETHAYSSAAKSATSKPARSPPSAFPELTHEAHAYSLFAQRDQAAIFHKPGPSAFPQMPHEVYVQHAAARQDVLSSASCQNIDTCINADQQQTAAEQQHPAEALQNADQGYSAASEHETQQEGVRQFAKSHHGGYMQREGQERTPHRRTTRSMLRGADVQTGMFTFLQHHPAQACLLEYRGVLMLPVYGCFMS